MIGIRPRLTERRRLRWSTPITGYRSFGPVRLASRGEGRWHDLDRQYTYLQLTIEEVDYNLQLRDTRR